MNFIKFIQLIYCINQKYEHTQIFNFEFDYKTIHHIPIFMKNNRNFIKRKHRDLELLEKLIKYLEKKYLLVCLDILNIKY